MSTDLMSDLEFAIRAARIAGAIALEHFGPRVDFQIKDDGSPVTVADCRVEAELRQRISATYPLDGVLGEEFSETVGSSGRRWVIDPIDGTVAYTHGIPLFGVQIALERDGDPVLGLIYLPVLNEMVYAAKGLHCWWFPSGHRAGDAPRLARVSGARTLSDGLLLYAGVEYFQRVGKAPVFDRVVRAGRTRGWGDCYAHVLVATGRALAMVEPDVKLWDSAPLVTILSEAGGTLTDWRGRRTVGGPDVVSTNGHVLPEVIRILQN